MFCAGSLVEGWACYATELMEEIGALTPLERLSEAQTRLRMAARAVADTAIHSGEFSLERAARVLSRRSRNATQRRAERSGQELDVPGRSRDVSGRDCRDRRAA